MTVVATLGDGVTALEEIRRLLPEVAVLDVRMPGLDGIEVARRLSVDDGVRTRTLIVTLHRDRVVIERAIAAGASGTAEGRRVVGSRRRSPRRGPRTDMPFSRLV